MATKCPTCRSFTCDREATKTAHADADAAFNAAALARADCSALHRAWKAARLRADKAWDLCIATGREHDRQMGIFIAALKVYVAKDTYLATCAISEGVRQSMQTKQCGATMLCMRGAR